MTRAAPWRVFDINTGITIQTDEKRNEKRIKTAFLASCSIKHIHVIQRVR